jgi:hypothetical protein
MLSLNFLCIAFAYFTVSCWKITLICSPIVRRKTRTLIISWDPQTKSFCYFLPDPPPKPDVPHQRRGLLQTITITFCTEPRRCVSFETASAG